MHDEQANFSAQDHNVTAHPASPGLPPPWPRRPSCQRCEGWAHTQHAAAIKTAASPARAPQAFTMPSSSTPMLNVERVNAGTACSCASGAHHARLTWQGGQHKLRPSSAEPCSPPLPRDDVRRCRRQAKLVVAIGDPGQARTASSEKGPVQCLSRVKSSVLLCSAPRAMQLPCLPEPGFPNPESG